MKTEAYSRPIYW